MILKMPPLTYNILKTTFVEKKLTKIKNDEFTELNEVVYPRPATLCKSYNGTATASNALQYFQTFATWSRK